MYFGVYRNTTQILRMKAKVILYNILVEGMYARVNMKLKEINSQKNSQAEF